MPRPSESTLKKLFALSGNQCAVDECRIPIVDPSSGVVVGKVCHIMARNRLGPRFVEGLAAPVLHGFDNLILLCPVHHDIVDAREDDYPIALLQDMKRLHESHFAGGRAASAQETLAFLRTNELVEDLLEHIPRAERSGYHTAPQYHEVIRRWVFQSQQPLELFISCGEADFALMFFRRLFDERGPGYPVPRISRVVTKGLNGTIVAAMGQASQLAPRFASRMDENLAEVERLMHLHNIEFERREWASFPKFHGWMANDRALIAAWGVNSMGHFHVATPLALLEERWSPQEFAWLHSEFESG